MKGFIEVSIYNSIWCVNINQIKNFSHKRLMYVGHDYEIEVDQSYEEIKRLIEEAQS